MTDISVQGVHICPARDQLLSTCPAARDNGLAQAAQWWLQGEEVGHARLRAGAPTAKVCEAHRCKREYTPGWESQQLASLARPLLPAAAVPEYLVHLPPRLQHASSCSILLPTCLLVSMLWLDPPACTREATMAAIHKITALRVTLQSSHLPQ